MIRTADGLLIGSPTLGGHAPRQSSRPSAPCWLKETAASPLVCSAARLDGPPGNQAQGRWVPFRLRSDPVKFSPDAATVRTLEESTRFGRSLRQEQRKQQRRGGGGLRESRSDPAVLALGRVVGSLCVLTTRKGSLSGAMVASWVSQASFTPPGITVAVAKDRAVEALLHKGDRFALNVLAEGRESGPMKQFLQPFEPGADRFEGLDLQSSPSEQPLLPEALAWMEAEVKQRMECGDHWLVYGEVLHGGLFDSEANTAVHHRRSGANY